MRIEMENSIHFLEDFSKTIVFKRASLSRSSNNEKPSLKIFKNISAINNIIDNDSLV